MKEQDDRMAVFTRAYTTENRNYCVELSVLEVSIDEFDMPTITVTDKTNRTQLDEWNVEEFLYGVHTNDAESMEFLEEEELTEEGVRMVKEVIAVGVTEGWITDREQYQPEVE